MALTPQQLPALKAAIAAATDPDFVFARLFWWQRGHCRLSYEAERRRYQLPPLLRGCIHDEGVSQ